MCKCFNCKNESSKDLEVIIYQLSNKKGEINKKQTYICRNCLNDGHISKHNISGYYIKTKQINKKDKDNYKVFYGNGL
jgi:hypothetical protein